MDKLKEILSKILEIDKNKINDQSSPDNIESWDSFNHLLIISEIEKELGVQIDIGEVGEIRNFGDIKRAVLKKLKNE